MGRARSTVTIVRSSVRAPQTDAPTRVTRDRRSSEGGHILIGGTGRAGTTLLVQYFTVLGFDTGFTETDARTRVNPVSHAGLEHSLKRTLAKGKSLPYVAKSPYFGANLAQYLEDGQLQIRGSSCPCATCGRLPRAVAGSRGWLRSPEMRGSSRAGS